MSYGHAADLARIGLCTEAGCGMAAVIKDDSDPSVRLCAVHGTARLLQHVGAA